jgi:hypothetical protein
MQSSNHDFFCVGGVMYSGEYDVCDVSLSVYPHRASLKNISLYIVCVVSLVAVDTKKFSFCPKAGVTSFETSCSLAMKNCQSFTAHTSKYNLSRKHCMFVWGLR